MLTTARLQQSLATACEQGEMCVHDRSGHQLSAIQWRLATATPSGWVDALVTAVESDGWITVATLDGESTRLWNHADRTSSLRVGEPVSRARPPGCASKRWVSGNSSRDNRAGAGSLVR